MKMNLLKWEKHNTIFGTQHETDIGEFCISIYRSDSETWEARISQKGRPDSDYLASIIRAKTRKEVESLVFLLIPLLKKFVIKKTSATKTTRSKPGTGIQLVLRVH